MNFNSRPTHALIAYCVLADRLGKPGMGIMQALSPFLAEVCRSFAGEMFDAGKFSLAVAERFGFILPRLAALGLAEQLARDGLLTIVSSSKSSTVYRYANASEIPADATSSPVTEAEVEIVMATFVNYCRQDERLASKDDQYLQAAFLQRLLNVDSMRILSRREASITPKKTAATLGKPASTESQSERDELHLDFLVSQFLLDLREKNASAFDRLSDIAFANMAAEAIACFSEPNSPPGPLTELTVYLDSPLLLDMLGVNAEYSDYGKELLEAIAASGAKPALFDHCVAEAESTIGAQLTYLRSGVNQISANWGTSAKPDLLSALSGCVGERAEKRLGITLERDPDINLHKRSPSTVGDIETTMVEKMRAWRNEEAKEYDRKSVWSILALRNTSSPCHRICDSKKILLTRNSALVRIANDSWLAWLKGSTKFSATHIDRWPPAAMSDKQFAGYLWARTGGHDGSISRARLLAHCSAAVRPRADVKARAINMVLELSGREEADDVAALLEDREAIRALMSATRGDPEDVTRDRLPFILEKVKLAAGEFAASLARDEADRLIEELELEHKKEKERLQAEAAATQAHLDEQVRKKEAEVIQQQQDKTALTQQLSALAENLKEKELAELKRVNKILNEGLMAGISLYKTWRWIVAIVFGCTTGLIALLSLEQPMVAVASSAVVGTLGFWFVPSLLDGPLERFAMNRLRSVIAHKDSAIAIPSSIPDFRNKTWDYLGRN